MSLLNLLGNLNNIGKPKGAPKRDKSCPNTDFISTPSQTKGKSREKIQIITKEALEALPDITIEGTYLSIDSYENMVKRAGGIIIDNPDIGPNSDKLRTPLDPRLGSISPNERCPTCNQTGSTCVGHPGLIPLRVPRINPHPLVFRMIIRILNSVCGSCGFLRLSEDTLRDKGAFKRVGIDRLIFIEKVSKDISCSKPAQVLEGVKIDKCLGHKMFLPQESVKDKKIYYKISKEDVKEELSPEEVFDILDSISDEDARILGFEEGSHPRDLILRGIPVIESCARPPIVVDGKTSQDQITQRYVSILKELEKINELIDKRKTNTPDYKKKLEILDSYISEYIGITENVSKKNIRSIKKILQGKSGMIRSNLQGKRTNRSARSVASLNPSLRPDEVGVSEHLASYLPIKIIATQENIGQLREFLKEDKVISVHKKYGNVFTKLHIGKESKDKFTIEVGDMVERVLMDGDYVIVNRFPSLSRQSVLGVRVKIQKDRMTIDAPMSYTSSMNLDFDGDELNIHGVQSAEAIEEIRDVMNVTNCIISGENNNPNIAIFQDAITGSYLLTNPETFIDPDRFMDYINLIQPPIDLNKLLEKLKKFYVPLDSGKVLFSACLPEGLYYQTKKINIQDGILISGVVDKTVIGRGGSYSLIQAIYKDYGPAAVMDFIYNFGRISERYITFEKGLTVGIKDCLPTDERLKEEIRKGIEKVKLNISTIDPQMTINDKTKQEEQIVASLSEIETIGLKLNDKVISPDNNLKIMSTSGGKGKIADITQAYGLLGQQFLKGKRPEAKLSKGTRCMPLFEQGDASIEAYGFCPNSFLEGMTPDQFYFESLGTRIGVVDRALTTQNVGYQYRMLAKSWEDIKIGKNMGVLNVNSDVVQGIYGYDGYNPNFLENVQTDFGEIPLPINIDRTAGRINNQFGYYKEDGKWIKK